MASARLEIVDLIRVIATWLVVFFHLDISGFEYGYLGVELFLVLSGFLMLYIRKADARSFIMARLKRIFPTLAVFLVGLGVFSFFLLTPKYYDVSFSNSVFTAFGLNYIWSNSFGYFGDVASLVPTLHLWTIPVEMTAYYWVAIGLSERKFTKFLVYLFPFLIFVLDLWLVGDPYYNITSRLLFFVLGAFAYRLSSGEETRQEIIRIFILVTLSVLFYHLKGDATYLLPQMALFALILLSLYIYDIPICLAAVGGSRLIRWLASISFETYLVHWGVISLWITLTLNNNINVMETAILLPLVLVGALILRVLTKAILHINYIGLVSLFLVGVMSLASHASDGFDARVNSDVSEFSNQVLMKLPKNELEELQNIDREIEIRFIGDSHARQFAAVASNSGLEVGLRLFSIDDLAQIIDEINEALGAGEKVAIAFRWSTKDPEDVVSLIADINEKKVALIRDVPSFPINPVSCLISEAAPILLTGFLSDCDVFRRDASGDFWVSRDYVSNSYDNNWKFITEQVPANFWIDTHDLICKGHKCRLSSGNTLFYRDDNHLNERLGYKNLGFSINLSGENE